uniref:Murine leukemia virus integrase C-terminal domain-containing protein n=1 Tax=Naja naja TaxID=35670 RepID=A0A8C6XHV6_NAJNA
MFLPLTLPGIKPGILLLTPQPWPYRYASLRLIKELSPTCTKPKWSTPHQVLLSILTAIKVESVKAWVHMSRVKHVPEPPKQWQVKQLEGLKLKLHCSPASPADLFS